MTLSSQHRQRQGQSQVVALGLPALRIGQLHFCSLAPTMMAEDNEASLCELTTTEELPANLNSIIEATTQNELDSHFESLESPDIVSTAAEQPKKEEGSVESSIGKLASLDSGPSDTPTDAEPVGTKVEARNPVPAPPHSEQTVDYPRQNDVLLPAEGYQLWPGNAHYLTLIDAAHSAFVQAKSRSEQAQLASNILKDVHWEGGRFLTAIEVPMAENSALAAQRSIVRTTAWVLMPDTDVLAQLGQALLMSTDVDEAIRHERKAKKRRRKERKRRRKERRRERRRMRALASQPPATDPVSPSAMGALQSLYYVPSYYPLSDNRNKTGLECESESLSSSSSSSDDDEPMVAQPPPKKKRITVRKTVIPRPIVVPPPPTVLPAGEAKATPEEGKTDQPSLPGGPINFHYKPKPNKSLKAAVYNEGELSLPKGVTVRPSGKWVR
jgi:hypothetical protein